MIYLNMRICPAMHLILARSPDVAALAARVASEIGVPGFGPHLARQGTRRNAVASVTVLLLPG